MKEHNAKMKLKGDWLGNLAIGIKMHVYSKYLKVLILSKTELKFQFSVKE
jgi:hypothetical protein